METTDFKQDTLNNTIREYNEMQTSGLYEQGKIPFFEAWDWLMVKTLINQYLWRNPDKQNIKIIDIGCGPGHDMVFIRKYLNERKYEGDIEIVGCDISPIMIKAAVEKGLDVTECDYRTNEFIKEHRNSDIVWANFSLIHLPLKEVDKSFRLLFDLARPGGIVGVGVKRGKDETITEDATIGGANTVFRRVTTYYSEERINELFRDNSCSIFYKLIAPRKQRILYDYLWIFGEKDRR